MINKDTPPANHPSSKVSEPMSEENKEQSDKMELIDTNSLYSRPSLRSRTFPINDDEEMIWVKLCEKSKIEFHGEALSYELYELLYQLT